MTSAPQNELERAIAGATGCAEGTIPFYHQLLKSKLTLLLNRPKGLVPQLKIQGDGNVDVAVWNSDGRSFIAVFSCAARANEAIKTLKQSREEYEFHQIDGNFLFKMLAQAKNRFNVIVNPACCSGALELKEEHLDGLADGSILEPPTPGSEVLSKLIMFGSMHFPAALVEAMPPLLVAHPEVRAAWLFRDLVPADLDEDDSDPDAEDYKPDVPDYVLGLLVADGFTKGLETEIERVANGTFAAPQRCRIWNMDPTDSALIDIMGEYPEFYAAPGFLRCEMVLGRRANTGPARDFKKNAAAALAWEPRNKLERAMQKSLLSPTANPELFRQLRKCPVTFLMPYDPAMVGMKEFGNGSSISFAVWKSNDVECVPLFTSPARLEEALRATGDEDKQYCIADLPGEKLFEIMVAVKLGYKVALNPGCVTGCMTLDTNTVRMLADGSILKPITPETKVRRSAEIMDAADYPTNFIQPVFEFLRSQPVAQAAWLFRQSPPPKTGGASYVIGLLTTGETGSELEQDLMVVGESVCPPDCSFGVTILDLKKPAVAQMAATFLPFYAAPDFQKPVAAPDAKKI